MQAMRRTTIYRANTDHIKRIIRIGKETFFDTFIDTNTKENLEKYLQENFNTERVEKELRHPCSLFYLASIENQVTGYLKLNTGDAQTEPVGNNAMEIERIYVLNSWHGKGVGQDLMEYALQVAKTKGVGFVWLGVWENNHRAIRFYEKNGFQVFDTHTFCIGEEAQTDLLMRRPV